MEFPAFQVRSPWGWDYANKTPGSRWIIVSNYRETRLYSKDRTPSHYEVFELDHLDDLDAFKRFFFVLSRGNLLPPSADARSVLDDLLVASAQMEVEITRKLYGQYRDLRNGLFKDLGVRHPNIPALDRLRFTQTILDRALFIAFAEDRGLIPARTLKDAIEHEDKYDPKPVWHNLLRVFQWVDKGDTRRTFPAYNGGLFADDPDLNDLHPSDGICRALGALGAYDFRDDVSVDVLGHIFEQSISDLEEMRAVAAGRELPTVSKRKAEGVFYTPAYITRFIVDQTLGRHLDEKLEEARSLHAPDAPKLKPTERTARRVKVWETYRTSLIGVRVLDPSCGSGAFLLAAYDLLERQYERVKGELAALGQPTLSADYSVSTILNNNLFGVDLNAESVEITRLSLWLRTAARGRKLTYLDRNIKRGNSVVSSPKVDPHAFNWERGTASLRALAEAHGAEDESIDARWREGFDVVIGNPPYVRQELLTPFKPHLEKEFRSYHGVADLYVYFYELGLRVLKDGGRLGFISSGTFARANFAKPFRELLPTIGRIETLVDFGENQPFDDAEMVRPSIVVMRKGATSEAFRYLMLDEKIPDSLALAMEAKGVECSAQILKQPEWSFHSDSRAALKDKLSRSGTHLGIAVGGAIRYGVKTGLNEAFVLTEPEREAIVKADQNCASLIKKLVVGEDLRPWYQEDEGRWLITIPCGWTRDQLGVGSDSSEAAAWDVFRSRYPSVAAHLMPFVGAGRKRQDKGDYWWELRPCAYYAEFEKPKIFWAEIAKLPRFSWDLQGLITNNKGSIIPSDDPSFLAILQSRASWFWLSHVCQPLRLRAGLWQYQLFSQFVERLPIPAMTDEQRAPLAALALKATEGARARYTMHQKTRNRMGDLIPKGKKLNEKLTSWWLLDFPSLRAELQKTFKSDIVLKDRDDWEALWKERRAEHEALTAKLVACEEEINDRVYGLFGLDAEERRIIERETKYPYGEV